MRYATIGGRQQGKSLAAKHYIEALIASEKPVKIMSASGHVCEIVQGPWKYQPSYVRSLYDSEDI